MRRTYTFFENLISGNSKVVEAKNLEHALELFKSPFNADSKNYFITMKEWEGDKLIQVLDIAFRRNRKFYGSKVKLEDYDTDYIPCK